MTPRDPTHTWPVDPRVTPCKQSTVSGPGCCRGYRGPPKDLSSRCPSEPHPPPASLPHHPWRTLLGLHFCGFVLSTVSMNKIMRCLCKKVFTQRESLDVHQAVVQVGTWLLFMYECGPGVASTGHLEGHLGLGCDDQSRCEHSRPGFCVDGSLLLLGPVPRCATAKSGGSCLFSF